MQKNYLYLAFATDEVDGAWVKVGMSGAPLVRRIDIQKQLDHKIHSVYSSAKSLRQAYRIEHTVLHKMRAYRQEGEWLHFPLGKSGQIEVLFDAAASALRYFGEPDRLDLIYEKREKTPV